MTGELWISANTLNQGRVALNNAFSGTANFNIVNISDLSAGAIVAGLGVDSTGTVISGSVNSSSTFLTLSDSTPTITWGYNIGANAYLNLVGNRALSITGVTDGAYGTLIIKQDVTGKRQLSLSATSGTHKIINGGGGVLLLSSSGNAEDVISFAYRASTTTYYWNVGYNYN